MPEYNPYEDMHMVWAQVDEIGVTLLSEGKLHPNIIDLPWPMWNAILVHILKQREEIEAELKEQNKELPGFRIPRPDEINFKDFPGIK
jgi:hypothetical protein